MSSTISGVGVAPAGRRRIRANELDLGVVGGHTLHAREECLTAGLLDGTARVVLRRKNGPPVPYPFDPSVLGQAKA